MFDKLDKLKNNKYVPKIIFDIGAHHGTWTNNMLKIYPNSKYYLFEAINYSELDNLNNYHNISIHKNIILSDKVKQINWYEGCNTGDSIFKEKSIVYKDIKPVIKSAISLDFYIKQNNLFNNNPISNIFIKIDCQGSEIDILKGASSILPYTDFILLEIPLFGKYNENVPNFREHIEYLDNIGFIPYDILDNHYINNFNMQVDMLFINKNNILNKQVQYDLTYKLDIQ
jgi:FkbM family methyltransferase